MGEAANTEGDDIAVSSYEHQLANDREWAMSEGSLHFEKNNAVHRTLKKIAQQLERLRIPYALVDGMALFQHGYERFTSDIDILVSQEGIDRIHQELEGRGYLPPYPNSRHLRDTETGVRIEFLVTGGFPGDGKEKPVSFPNPEDVAVEINGIRCISLAAMIELKLASGMSGAGRRKDLSDVQELIRVLNLPALLENQLNPYVRATYRQLYDELQSTTVRFVMSLPAGVDAKGATSIDDLVASASVELIAKLKQYQSDGIVFDPASGKLWTSDPSIAEKHRMVNENDYWERRKSD